MIWWLKKQLLRVKTYLYDNCSKEAESLVIWYAVSLALGAAFYITFPFEIPTFMIVIYLELVLGLLYIYRNNYLKFKVLTYVLVFTLGLSIAKADAIYHLNKIEKEVDEITYLRGQIKVLDYNYNNKPRILLTNVNNFKKDLKGDFKVSLTFKPEWLKEGTCVELVAKFPKSLTPNPLSNYNQERSNFYKTISANGFTISPIFEIDCNYTQSLISNKIKDMQKNIENIIDNNTTSQNGSIIKAISIGKKSNISQELNEMYRISGLAHFLSISGMHMSIIALLVFFIIQLILIPFGYGQYDLRKPSAIISIFATFLYFLISGQSISCIRAFSMITIVLLATLLNRRAISLRLWAFALIIVVLISPSSVVNPGFLMSFSATLGLISFYEVNMYKINQYFNQSSILNKLMLYFCTVLITDFIATLMTLPYSIYFFNQFSVYTILGNMLASSIIAFYTMPALLLFLISIPFGAGHYTIKILEHSISIINQITQYISSLPFAKIGENVTPFSDLTVLLITLGLLWLCIWQNKWRKLGIYIILIGIISFAFTPNADFVFNSSGDTYAYKNDNGKLQLSPWHSNKFLSKIWVKNNKISTNSQKLKCDEKSCIYKNKIEFGKGLLKFNNKDIPFKDGGYIDCSKGVFYKTQRKNRIWN